MTPSTPNQKAGREVTRAEARELSRKAGQHQEPYRGYGHDLKDGRFLFCPPDGKFYILEMAIEPKLTAE